MVILVLTAAFAVILFAAHKIYVWFWDRNLTFKVEVSQNTVFEGESITVSEKLNNGKYLPLPWVWAEYRMSRHFAVLDSQNRRVRRGDINGGLFIIGMNKSVTRKKRLLCSKRGHYTSNEALLYSNNLFLSRLHMKTTEISYYVTVYPKLIEVDESVIPFRKISGEIVAKRFINPDPFEFKGIREYQPFDNQKQINWNATAKTGVLMSNIYNYTVSQDVTVLLNVQSDGLFYFVGLYENAIRLAAFLARHYIGEGISVGLVSTGIDSLTDEPVTVSSGMSAHHLHTIYTTLACIDLDKIAVPMAARLETAADNNKDSVLILISSYQGNDLYQKFLDLKEKGRNVLWIIPQRAGQRPKLPLSDDIVAWEVYDD